MPRDVKYDSTNFNEHLELIQKVFGPRPCPNMGKNQNFDRKVVDLAELKEGGYGDQMRAHIGWGRAGMAQGSAAIGWERVNMGQERADYR